MTAVQKSIFRYSGGGKEKSCGRGSEEARPLFKWSFALLAKFKSCTGVFLVFLIKPCNRTISFS